MARKVVATLKKRDKRRPMAYVDKAGNVKHFSPKRKKKKFHTILAKKVVGKDVLKRRKQAKTILFVKGKKVYETKSGLGKRRKRRGRKKVRRKVKGRRTRASTKRKRAGKKAWRTRVRKYGKSGCKKGRRRTKPRRCRRRRVKRRRRPRRR